MPSIISVLFLILAIVLVAAIGNAFTQQSTRNEVSSADRVRHREDGDSHIYYRKDGELIHECEGCYGCMHNYAEQLREQGVQVDEVILGHRSSGDLTW